MKPLIGITAYHRIQPGTSKPYHVCYPKNAHAVEKAGGLPVLIPEDAAEDTLRAIYQRLDGVLLPGGGDIDPTFYNAVPHKSLDRIDATRDKMEMMLTRWAIEDDRPLFGICRGMQVMNVALGGTLIQDIPDLVESRLRHDIPRDQPRSTILHDVIVDKNTRLASILNDTQVPVNSLHHQSLEKVADGFVVTAHADDGVIEGVEIPEKRFVLAVQWHPEDLYENDPRMQNLFEAFVKAATTP